MFGKLTRGGLFDLKLSLEILNFNENVDRFVEGKQVYRCETKDTNYDDNTSAS